MGAPGAVLTLATPAEALKLRDAVRSLGAVLQQGSLADGVFSLQATEDSVPQG